MAKKQSGSIPINYLIRMEITFEILIADNDMSKNLSFNRDVFRWGGVDYPQGFEYVTFGKHFIVQKTPVAEYLAIFFREVGLKGNPTCISITGDGLFLLKKELLEGSKNKIEDELRNVINNVLDGVSQWIVSFEIDHNVADRTVFGKLEDVLEQIKISLKTGDDGFTLISRE